MNVFEISFGGDMGMAVYEMCHAGLGTVQIQYLTGTNVVTLSWLLPPAVSKLVSVCDLILLIS
jgi:hypothetical protein